MSTRRGLALLLALACVVVVLAAAAGTLAALAHTQRTVLVTAVDDRLDELLAGGEQLAAAWLARGSAQVVLPPEGGPVVVADEDLVTAAGTGSLHVACHDALAAPPIDVAAGPLRSALPGRWLALAIPPAPPQGWPADTLERLAIPDGLRRFPLDRGAAMRVWRDGTAPAAVPGRATVDSGAPAAPSLAEAVAIPGDGRINLNTAPEPLLREAWRLLGIGGVEQLLERRRQGLFTEAPAQPAGAAARAPITLVASSERWRALVVARWNGARRARWVVFAGNPPTQWIVQRHDADR